MKTLRVLDGNCGDCGKEYKEWLEKNLPEDVELDWVENTSGVTGGLFDEDGFELDNTYWGDFCNS